MITENGKSFGEPISSRRHALALILGACQWLPRALNAAETRTPIRLAISESLVANVNINDARAAMQIWIKRMSQELNLDVELNRRVFDTTEEIFRRARSGQMDTVALNVVEYRQIAAFLDPSQIISEDLASGVERYILLVKQTSGIKRLGDLRGHRLMLLKAPKMCMASPWLSSILDEEHLGQIEQFFGSVISETKASRVVLPVFFGQADACLTSQRTFDTMSELNPQVGKDLTVIAAAPPMVVTFYIFHKNYHGADRERFAQIYSKMGISNAAGRQLATLFQFENLVIRNITCLAPALAVLERVERIRNRPRAES